MKTVIPWGMALLGLGFASWAVATSGGKVSWNMGSAPTWLGGVGWSQGRLNISASSL